MSLFRWEMAFFVSDEAFHLARAAADFGLVLDALVTGINSMEAFVQLLAGVSLLAFHTLFLGPRTSLASDAAMFFGDMQFHFFHMLLCTWRLMHYLWTVKPRQSRPFIGHWAAFLFHTAIVWVYSTGIQVSIRMQFVGGPAPPPPPRPHPPPPPPPPPPLEQLLPAPSAVAIEATTQPPESPLPAVATQQSSLKPLTETSSLLQSARLPTPLSKLSIAPSIHLSDVSSGGPLQGASKDPSAFVSPNLSNVPPNGASDVAIDDVSSQAPSVEPPVPSVIAPSVSPLVEQPSQVPPERLICSSTGPSQKSPEESVMKSAAGIPVGPSDGLTSVSANQISKSSVEKSSRDSGGLSNKSFTGSQICGLDDALKPTTDGPSNLKPNSNTQFEPAARSPFNLSAEPFTCSSIETCAQLRTKPSTEPAVEQLLERRPTNLTRRLNSSSSYSVDESAL